MDVHYFFELKVNVKNELILDARLTYRYEYKCEKSLFLPCLCTPRTHPRVFPRSDPPRTSPPLFGWRWTDPVAWWVSIEPL